MKGVICREITHNLIKNGGKADIKTLKKSIPEFLVENSEFESALMEISKQAKDTKGKILFQLKNTVELS